MNRLRLAFLAFCILPIACNTNPEHDHRKSAAKLLTERYEQSRFSKWNLDARAAGTDCDVLYVRTTKELDKPLIQSMHTGAGAYEVVTGGIARFARDHTFRGVIYQDATERRWPFGDLTPAESEVIDPCR